MIKAIIFDLDGTMVNSEKASFEAWLGTARRMGKPFTKTDFGEQVLGVRVDEMMKNMSALWEMENQVDDIWKIGQEEWATAKAHITLMQGVHELHARIAELGLPWATATASDQTYTNDMLTRFNLLDNCAAIACGDEVVYTKPAPDIFLLAAERLNIDPKHCLAIEDSVPGHEAAAAAGMRVIAIPDMRFHTTDQYPHADYIFSSLDDVRENLEQLIAGQAVVA